MTIPTEPLPTEEEIIYKFNKEDICRFRYKPTIKIFIVNRMHDAKAKQNLYMGRTFSEDHLNNIYINVAESELELADERTSDKEAS